MARLHKLGPGEEATPRPAAAIFVAIDVVLVAGLVLVALAIDRALIYVGFAICAALFVVHALFFATILTGRVWLPRRRDPE